MCLHFPEARDARDARDAASGTEEAEAMARTPQDIFAAHASALAAGDIGRILEDYSDDAVLLTPTGLFEAATP
jgi:hypothetical protein